MNSTAATRSGVVAVRLPVTGPVHLVTIDDNTVCPTQVVSTHDGEGISTVVTGQKIRWVLEMMRGPEFAGANVARTEHRRRDDGVIEFTFHDALPGEPTIDLESTREQLLALGDAGETIAIRQRRAPVQEVLFAAAGVPGFGWRTFRVAEGAGPGTAVSASGTTLANEHLRVEVDPANGTLTIEADAVRVTGANRYVDGGDGGDTYNYSPPDADAIVDHPESVTIAVEESGPVRARIAVAATYRLPTYAIGDERSCTQRSDDTVPVELRTVLELRTGEHFLRVRVELDHRVRDHRLRAHFPLPATVDGSDAECAFAVVHRPLAAEGGPHERGLPTFVSRRFVDCSADSVGLALLHDGLLEYEVVGDGTELALTLLRATGYLSRAELAFRPNPAGPLDPLEGPQLQRPLALEYAVLPHRGSRKDARLSEAADDFLVPLERARGGGVPGARHPPTGHALVVDGAPVSAVLRDGENGALTVRVYNPSPEPTTARIHTGRGPAHGHVVDLAGTVLTAFEESVGLRAFEIITLRLA
ncbi:MAG: glycoside hydrolase family 38 C-terminal domain-containing protein [Acidimicrobiia bacterium]